MEKTWSTDNKILENIKKIIDENKDKEFVQNRCKKNVKREEICLTKESCWKTFVACEISSQQKSGKSSRVDEFLNSNNDVVIYERCKKLNAEQISEQLKNGKIRWPNKRGEYLIENMKMLENGEWNILLNKLKILNAEHSINEEKDVAKYLSSNFKGIGLKQSRNFIQMLGLSQYEIPIDSRVIKILKTCGVENLPSAGDLQNKKKYLCIEKEIQTACEKLKTQPCILDACFFASFETE